MNTDKCPNCNADLLDIVADNSSVIAANYGGRMIHRTVGVRYYYNCGAVVFHNEH
jgi:hypothetical protein